MQAARYTELESARGIAALLVLVHHCLLAFAPQFHGLVATPGSYSLYGTPLFAFINGSAAVIFFFALSGFVLTTGLIDEGKASRVVLAALKRLPRLAGPVLLVNLAAVALFQAGLNHNIELEHIVQSKWLPFHMNWRPEAADWLAAFYEGIWGTFITGTSHYNTNLWTMFYEFWGSLIALAVATPFIISRNLRRYWLALAFFSVVILGLRAPTAAYFIPFLAGVCVAANKEHCIGLNISNRTCLSVLAVAFIFFGYHEHFNSTVSSGFYAFLDPLSARWGIRPRIVLHTLASIAVIVLLLNRRGRIAALKGRTAVFLGALSFPIYLTQMSAILTVGAASYLTLEGFSPLARAGAATLVSSLAAFLAALPLIAFDRWWMTVLRSQIRFGRFNGHLRDHPAGS